MPGRPVLHAGGYPPHILPAVGGVRLYTGGWLQQEVEYAEAAQ